MNLEDWGRGEGMQSDTWKRLESVFFGALELPPEDRAAFVATECAGDDDLRREVEAVLAAHDDSGGTGALFSDSDRLARGVDPGASGRIGVYEVEGLLGRGGMGDVYRARRADAHYEQQVAIKLVRSGRDSAFLVDRFNTERQILARLEHPNIATLLDGGVTDDGQPYLVMQYIDGQPITAYAENRALPLDDRLELFLTVCGAVQFAHANLVVHRDLKPSNILVTDGGEVKLLDFGVAKVLDVEGWAGAPTSDLLLLTPEHAAPEQFLGEPVTTATDVYALGVLLYELLTGSRPFQALTPIELPRAVCEQEPKLPSTVVALEKSESDLDQIAVQRLRGDLDAIVLKAISKEPERRYATVGDFGKDVRRFINGFPVEARPVTWRYVAARFVRRHRAGVSAVAALVLTLAALAVVSIQYAVTTRTQARTIAKERDVAVGVSTFLEELFEAPDPFARVTDRRDTLRVGAFLDEGAAKVRADLGAQPAVQARLMTVLAKVYRSLGQTAMARSLLEDALIILEDQPDAEPVETAYAQTSMGMVLLEEGDPVEAEALFRSAESMLVRDSATLGDELTQTVGSLGNSLMHQGRFAEAEETFQRAMALGVTTYGPDAAELASYESGLAAALHRQSKLAEAERHLLNAADIQRSAYGPDHLRVAGAVNNLGTLYLDMAAPEEATEAFEEALRIIGDRLPRAHPRTATTLANLAVAKLRTGDLEEAEALLREVLATRRTLLGPDHPAVAMTMSNLAAVVARLGREEEGFDLNRQALKGYIAALGPEHPNVATGYQNLGVSQYLLDRPQEAAESFAAALAIRRTKLPADHPLTASVLEKLGLCFLDLGRLDEAEPVLRESYEIYTQWQAEEPAQWDHVLGLMVRLLTETGREAEAAEFEALRTQA